METTIAPPDGSDFRALAITASRILLKDRPGDPVASGLSYCIPAEEDSRAEFGRLQTTAKVCLAVGIAGVVVGGCIGFYLKFKGLNLDHPDWQTLVVALCFTLAGVVVLFIPQLRARKLLTRTITRRLGSIPESAIRVDLKDTTKFDDMRVLPDDLCYLLLHPEQRCVQMEGVCCRYLLHADDVDIILMPPTKTRAVQLSYNIGDVRLTITLSADSIKKQVFWQLTGKSGTLYDLMRHVLE